MGLITKHCNIHNLDFKAHPGFLEIAQCPACDIEKNRLELQHIKQQQLAHSIKQMFNHASIPPRFEHVEFETYQNSLPEQDKIITSLLKFAEDLENNLKLGRNILMIGKTGTGKTHLSISILKKALRLQHSGLFTNFFKMIDTVNAAGWDKLISIENYVNVDLLILDDLIPGFNREDQKIIIKILNERYEQMKSTIIQTNLTLEQLKQELGERIIDRLKDQNSLILYFNWNSYRK